jgi:hypothetical protein
MNEMVERVARALCEEACDQGRLFAYESPARAAITAMREPTANMCRSGGAPDPLERGHSSGISGEVWRSMIDAALEQ